MDQDDFGYYHPEKEERDPFNFRKPKETDMSRCPKTGMLGHFDVAAIWGWNGDEYGDWEEDKPEPAKEVKCECGSSAIKWPVHSDWCPKYRRPEDE